MKTLRILLAALCGAGLTLSAIAQQFDAGSNGSLGDVVIDTDNTTIQLPPDGVLHYASLRVNSGIDVYFERNTANTPVYILSDGDVIIHGRLWIEGHRSIGNFLPGEPGPGGFQGGYAGFSGATSDAGGAGHGPGGGKPGLHHGSGGMLAGSAAYATVPPDRTGSLDGTPQDGEAYGSPLLIPLIGGSGGGGVFGDFSGGGGGGGGAMLIASDTRIQLSGTIYARGGDSDTGTLNAGSGGAVRLVAPGVYGDGYIYVYGGTGYWSRQGGDGRIRVDSIFRIDPEDSSEYLNIHFDPSTSVTIGGNMIARLSNPPTLRIVNAAGTAIPTTSDDPVFITLPQGSTPDRQIIVQAENFDTEVPITVMLIPDSGDPIEYEATIDNEANDPAQVTVNVTLPINVRTQVQAWVADSE